MDNQQNNPPELKHCPDCDTEKSVDQFGVNRSNFDGRANNCLECARAQIKHCPGCDTEKSVDQFGVNRSNFDGRANNCLECARAHDRERRGTKKEAVPDPQIEALKTAICEAREECVTPHAAELVEDLWRTFPREEFAQMWATHLRECKKSKSLMSRQKALEHVVKVTADHREASIGDITSLSDEDLARALKKLLSQPRLAEYTSPDEADGPATHIA